MKEKTAMEVTIDAIMHLGLKAGERVYNYQHVTLPYVLSKWASMGNRWGVQPNPIHPNKPVRPPHYPIDLVLYDGMSLATISCQVPEDLMPDVSPADVGEEFCKRLNIVNLFRLTDKTWEIVFATESLSEGIGEALKNAQKMELLIIEQMEKLDLALRSLVLSWGDPTAGPSVPDLKDTEKELEEALKS
jgi:hypothetical protein